MEVIILASPNLDQICKAYYLNGKLLYREQNLNSLLLDFLKRGYKIVSQSSFSGTGITWTLVKEHNYLK